MRRASLAVTLLAALLLGSCGIPSETNVRVLNDGPSAGPVQDNDTSPTPPVTRDATREYRTFVTNYLEAAAGDPDGWKDRALKFMTPALQKTFKSTPSSLKVVRPIGDPLYTPGDSSVSVDVQEVGQLTKYGELVPSGPVAAQTLTFQVELHGDDGLYIAGAPPVLLLSVAGLETYYQRHTIYFWNIDNTGLVPDLRYMPGSVPTVQQPTMILNWLVEGGRSGWLSDAVNAFPDKTSVSDNIPAISHDQLEIKLSDQAVAAGDKAGLDRLSQQLFWSLRPLQPTSLKITIGHRDPVTYPNTNYLGSNASYWLHDQPDKFVVDNGSIRRLTDSANDIDPVPVLKQNANKGIQSAALSSAGKHVFAAVVTGSGASSALRVAVAPNGEQADLRPVRGLKGPLGHPAWALTPAGDADTGIGLITSGNRLYSFGTGSAAAQPVQWQDGDPGPITAFSVAPDGYRVALVAGGKLYRAVLTGAGANGVAIGAPQPLQPPGLTSLSAVAWSSESFLVISGLVVGSGQVKRVALDDLSIDSVRLIERIKGDIGTDPVSDLTAYPINPVTHFSSLDAPVAYMAHGDAWNAVGYPDRITSSQVAWPSASAPPGGTTTLTAPFFLN